MFFLAVIMLTQAASDPANQARRADTRGTVVVTGRRSDPDAELEDCLARKCPVAEDAAATLLAAHAHFLAGNYRKADRVLRRSIGRNRKFAKSDPLPVAALWRESAKVGGHLGEYDYLKTASIQSYLTLRNGLPRDDAQTLAGLLELGDAQVHVGRPDIAIEHYREAMKRAERSGAVRMGAIARYRLANLIAVRSVRGPSAADEREVAAILAPLIGSPDPVLARFDFIARLFQARLAERRGAHGRINAVLAALPKHATPPPLLLTSQPVKLPKRSFSNCHHEQTLRVEPTGKMNYLGCGTARDQQSTENVERQWIDVGFWIRPDGSVRDIELVRQSAVLEGDWPKHVHRSVGSRRYTRLNLDDPGLYRLERFTLTAGYQVRTGYKIRARTLNSVIETADITPG